jgi:long-chain acyl-CoA synthetase
MPKPTIRSTLDTVETLPELFAFRVAKTPEAPAFRQYDPKLGKWIVLSWQEMAELIERWKKSLAELRLELGSRIGILLPNGIDAVAIDLAALALGLVPTPMHAIDNPESIGYILGDCEARVLVIRTKKQWEAIKALGITWDQLVLVVITEDETPNATSASASASGPRVIHLADWLAGDGLPSPAGDTAPLPGPHDLAAVVYTSGTTGKPKGVMLSHRNVVANVLAVYERVPARQSDVFLSFLPLSHTFERTAGYYMAIAAGSSVAYVRSVAEIAADLRFIRPDVLVSVPRIYERFYAQLQERLATGGALRRALFEKAVALGWRRFCVAQGLPVEGRAGLFDALLWPLLDQLVGAQVRASLGGRLRVAVSGGAALSQEIAKVFLALGVPIVQGYGMTETSPVVSTNTVEDNDPRTVGRPLQGIEVRLGENTELQVRGPSVMSGYLKRPEDTARILLEGGWLRTGDQAALEGGRIRILGRIKEIIVTSTGEKIAPADLELAIAVDPLFDQVFVVGENRPFLIAVVVLNPVQWAHFAQSLNVPPALESLQNPIVRAALVARIDAATRSFPRYAMPRAVVPSLEPWTVQNTFMTPTLKIKRNNLEQHFADQIEAAYQKPAAR